MNLLKDDYFRSDLEVIYIVKSIPLTEKSNDAESFVINSEYYSQITRHCSCTRKCDLDCECLKPGGSRNYKNVGNSENMRSDLDSVVLLDERFSSAIFECNSLCSCAEFCGNRLVQFGPRKNLKVTKCLPECKGFGLVTNSKIPKGGFVCEYAGEIITQKEARSRHDYNEKNERMNYILCMNENFGNKHYQTIVDPSILGNIGRYLNHSCYPNCFIVAVRVDVIIPKLCIFAKRDILPLEELTFDYGETCHYECEGKRSNLKPCLCGSEGCKQWLPFVEFCEEE